MISLQVMILSGLSVNTSSRSIKASFLKLLHKNVLQDDKVLEDGQKLEADLVALTPKCIGHIEKIK